MHTPSDDRAFYLVAAQGANSPDKSIYGPPTLPYVDSLQAALDEQTDAANEAPVRVIPVETPEFIEFLKELPEASQEALEPFVMWAYYRDRPGEDESDQDVFAHLPDEMTSTGVLNDARDERFSLGDKWVNYEKAMELGIPIPETVELNSVDDISELPFSYPLVIKGHPSGRGLDVHLCQDEAEAKQAYESCRAKGLEVVGQEYIEHSHGRDLRILVVDGEIVLTLARQGGEREFLSNVSNGGQYLEYELSDDDKERIQAVIDAFPVDIAGIDFLFSPDGLLFTEINSAPGWSGMAQDMTRFLAKLIRSRFKILEAVEGL